ncbi:putative oxidoreductase [compost metagenome]
MLLTAHSLGIAAYWKTGKECYHPKMKEFFYLKEKDEVLAFIYLGYASNSKDAAQRISTKELTTWIEY